MDRQRFYPSIGGLSAYFPCFFAGTVSLTVVFGCDLAYDGEMKRPVTALRWSVLGFPFAMTRTLSRKMGFAIAPTGYWRLLVFDYRRDRGDDLLHRGRGHAPTPLHEPLHVHPANL